MVSVFAIAITLKGQESESISVIEDTTIVSKDSNVLSAEGQKEISDTSVKNEEKQYAVPVKIGEGFSFISLLRGLLGMLSLFAIAFLFSTNRKASNWVVVGKGLMIQVLLAIGVLYVPVVQGFFEFIGKIFVKILDFTNAGTEFLFASMVTGQIESSLVTFAITILPTIIFFSALTSVLFYYGIIQKVVYGMAWIMTKLLKLSGAESLSVAGNIFLGQTESPLIVHKLQG